LCAVFNLCYFVAAVLVSTSLCATTASSGLSKEASSGQKTITHEHVLKSLGDAGRRLTAAETRAKISEFQEEARAVMAWAKDKVIKRMLKAAARVGLKVGGRTVDTFNDLKTAWQMNGDQPNVAHFYATCHGD
jgi:hypothetical protein